MGLLVFLTLVINSDLNTANETFRNLLNTINTSLRTTMGFVQVQLEVVAIGSSNIAAFVRAGQTSLSISSYYLSLSKAKQRLRADGNSNATPAQSPVVG